MEHPDELSALLPYLDGIYDNLSGNESAAVELDAELIANHEGNQATRSTEPKTKKPRRQLASPLPYSTDLQRRKKAELHALRSEAQQLAARMEHLGQALENRERVDTTAELRVDYVERRKRHSRALVECEERVRAERTNRELKTILMQQFKLFQSVRKELRQGDVLDGMEFFERLQPTADRPFFRLDVSAPILSELSSKLEQLSLQADFVVPAVSQNLTGAFHTQSRCLAASGNCIEMTSTTALECSAPEAADILWRLISNKDNEAADKIFSFTRERSPQYCDEVYDTNCIASLIMQNAAQLPLYVNAASTFRKYEEKDRVIIVGLMTWLLPTEGLEFEGKYWAVMSSSPTDPAHTSVVQVCHRLQVKNEGAQSVGRTQQVMTCLGNQIRCYLQLQQNAVLDKAGPMQGS